MQPNIAADFTNMPASNLVILFVGMAALLIIIAVIIKKLGVINLGPIKIEQRGQSTMHSMNETIKDLDDICRRQMRQITNNMKNYISSVFAETDICTIARVAISSSIRYPMYESVANNHFTTELMPENYALYRERIIEMMKDEYVSLSSVSKEILCNRETLPAWEQVSGRLIGCIDLWIKRISSEVMRTCDKKRAVYDKYETIFKAMKDGYRAEIAKDCSSKNERYSAVLKGRIGRE